MNPDPNPSSDDRKKAASESVSYYVDQLAIGLGVEIPVERAALYVAALSDLSEQQIHHGFTIALREFRPNYGRTFPAPGDIRAWGEEWRPQPDEARTLIQNQARLVDDSSAEDRKNYFQEFVAEMRAAIAAGTKKLKTSEEIAEAHAAERNGQTEVPEDPDAKAAWARQKARNAGWMQ